MNPSPHTQWPAFLAGVVLALTLVTGVLLIQNARHGWPFTLQESQPQSNARSQHTASALESGDGATRAAVALNAREFDRLGVQLETARVEQISGGGRYPAVITLDESRISHVHTRVSGWVEQLNVNTTGEKVRAGQTLAAVFSQELLASQTEYLTALKRSAATPDSVVLDAARTRLRVLGMSDEQIAALERAGAPQRLVRLHAPRDGIVVRRGVTVGTAVDPSTELMTIADLSRVWILAEVPETEGGRIKPGTVGALSFPGISRTSFSASVAFVYPTLTERTRTIRVRFAVPNPGLALRPGLYGTVSFNTLPHETLTVARDAVVDTGQSQHVFVRTPSGLLEPRDVTLGERFAERVEVLSGISPGEEIVTAGVFLIDSESRLRASGGGMGHSGHGQAPPAPNEANAEQARAADHSGHGS